MAYMKYLWHAICISVQGHNSICCQGKNMLNNGYSFVQWAGHVDTVAKGVTGVQYLFRPMSIQKIRFVDASKILSEPGFHLVPAGAFVDVSAEH